MSCGGCYTKIVNAFKTRLHSLLLSIDSSFPGIRKDESLRDYKTCFNVEALQIEGCNDNLSLTTMMAGLKVRKLLWSIEKYDPLDFQELLSRAQKYTIAEELMSSKHNKGFAEERETKKKFPKQ